MHAELIEAREAHSVVSINRVSLQTTALSRQTNAREKDCCTVRTNDRVPRSMSSLMLAADGAAQGSPLSVVQRQVSEGVQARQVCDALPHRTPEVPRQDNRQCRHLSSLVVTSTSYPYCETKIVPHRLYT